MKPLMDPMERQLGDAEGEQYWNGMLLYQHQVVDNAVFGLDVITELNALENPDTFEQVYVDMQETVILLRISSKLGHTAVLDAVREFVQKAEPVIRADDWFWRLDQAILYFSCKVDGVQQSGAENIFPGLYDIDPSEVNVPVG